MATDGYGLADETTLQYVATEAFLGGCRYKEAATLVLNQSPTNIQDACEQVKKFVSKKKGLFTALR